MVLFSIGHAIRFLAPIKCRERGQGFLHLSGVAEVGRSAFGHDFGLALALTTSPSKAVYVLLLYVVLHIVEGYVLVPFSHA
ncbi:MAG TPA: hypothetical protein VGR78_04755 [Verrucomicrobiae bacterium]|nr:hypothetical protein [Verrucomicrobiae bacterium]